MANNIKKVSSCYEETFMMDDGETIGMKAYGKYKPNVTFLINKNFHGKREIIHETDDAIEVSDIWEDVDRRDFNLPEGCLSVVYGTFFMSKKGTKIFRIEENGPHMLIRDSWGGCFNDYRGNALPDENKGALYFRIASSNGGGTGYDYAVLPKDWKFSMSIDDL